MTLDRTKAGVFGSLAALGLLVASGCGDAPSGAVAVAQNGPLKPAAPPADAKGTLPPFPLAPSEASPATGPASGLPAAGGVSDTGALPSGGTPAATQPGATPPGSAPTAGSPPAGQAPAGGAAGLFQGLLGATPPGGASPPPSGGPAKSVPPAGAAPPAGAIPPGGAVPPGVAIPPGPVPGSAPVAPSPAAEAPPLATGPAQIVTGSGKQLDKAVAGVGAQGRDYELGMVTTPVAAYFSAKQQIVFNIQIPDGMNTFKAFNSRYPKSAEEFTKEILKPANITLPELPPGQRYVYDPETGQLFVQHPKK